MFGEVDALYEFMSNCGGNSEKVSISDVGSIVFVEEIPTKSKIIKVTGDLQTEKVMEHDAVTHFYLKIIKIWENSVFPK